MLITSLTSQKGGVCKSTTCEIMASRLSKELIYESQETSKIDNTDINKYNRVLAVDLDPQGNLSLAVGANILDNSKSLYEVFKGNAQLSDLIQKTNQGFDIVTGGLPLAGADMDFTQTGREFMLKEALESVQNHYDYCMIDTPPTLGILTVNALTASNGVIIPLTPDLFALQGLTQLYQLIQRIRKYSNHNLKIDGLLITKYDPRTNISKAMMDDIYAMADKIGTKVYSTKIRTSVAVRESQVMQTDLLTEAPKANATLDYNAFIDEFLKDNNYAEK